MIINNNNNNNNNNNDSWKKGTNVEEKVAK